MLSSFRREWNANMTHIDYDAAYLLTAKSRPEYGGLAYVGTGQNASPPATELSDSVLALDLDTGRIVWHWQALAGDIYNDGCSGFPPNANCPKERGPDFDIGASVIIHRDGDGSERLLVGQKSGDGGVGVGSGRSALGHGDKGRRRLRSDCRSAVPVSWV